MELLFSRIEANKFTIVLFLRFKDNKLTGNGLRLDDYWSPDRVISYLKPAIYDLTKATEITVFDGEVTIKPLRDLFKTYSEKVNVSSLGDFDIKYPSFLIKLKEYLNTLEAYDSKQIKGFITEFFTSSKKSNEIGKEKNSSISLVENNIEIQQNIQATVVEKTNVIKELEKLDKIFTEAMLWVQTTNDKYESFKLKDIL